MQQKAKGIILNTTLPNRATARPTNSFLPLRFVLEQYTIDCFVDVDIMLANNASLSRGNFKDNAHGWVLVHVSTTSFFTLNAMDDNALRL